MLRRPSAATLVDALWPRATTAQGLVRAVILVVGFSALMAVSARVAIPLPFTPVPFTLQPLGLLLTGALLGSRLGALALLAYLAEGLAGLPVFSAGRSAWTPVPPVGLPLILGPTAGYLFIYPVVAFAVGWLVEHGWGQQVARTLVAMAIGMALVYVGGALWLARFVGVELALAQGVLPFVLWDAIKVGIAAAVLPSGWALLGRRTG